MEILSFFPGGGKTVLPKPPNFTYTGDYRTVSDGKAGWMIELLSSGEFVPGEDIIIDVFCVGGGSGGNPGAGSGDNFYHYFNAGGGGGGGFTATAKSIPLYGGDKISVEIGAGGKPQTKGGTTKFGNILQADGGGDPMTSNTYDVEYGRKGSSGGGGGQMVVVDKEDGNTEKYSGGDGGSDGGNGRGNYPGTGNGKTTRAFGEENGKLYAGGGAGGRVYKTDAVRYYGGEGGGGDSGMAGEPNTGGGGGGAIYDSGSAGSGGSGIVIIRNAREAA